MHYIFKNLISKKQFLFEMNMFWSDRYPHSSASADTLGILKYIDQVSFYSMGLDGWHYSEADFQD